MAAIKAERPQSVSGSVVVRPHQAPLLLNSWMIHAVDVNIFEATTTTTKRETVFPNKKKQQQQTYHGGKCKTDI